MSGRKVGTHGRWRALLDRFVPAYAALDPEVDRKARFAVGMMVGCIPLGALYALRLQWLLTDPLRTPLSLLMLGLSAVCALSLVLLRRGAPLLPVSQLVIGYVLFLCTVLGYFLGGAQGPLPFWLAIMPAASVFSGSIRSGLVCFAVCQLIYAGFGWTISQGYDLLHVPPRPLLTQIWIGSACGLFVATFTVMLAFDRTKEEALRVLALTHQALLRARDHARAASQGKSTFLARVGEDLRTPMALVIDAADLLAARAGRNSPAAGPLDTIGRNARRLMQTIDRIVDLSQIESDRLVIAQVSCDPRAIVAEVVEELRDVALQHEIELHTECAGDVPAEIVSDPARLRQILTSFVRNAILFSEGHEVCVSVRRVDRTPAEPRIQFDVRDTGVGIPAETLVRIFEPFQQATANAARRFGGTGLGLWITRSLCERMGGEISAESTPGAGSLFRAELPVHGAAGARPAADTAPAASAPAEIVSTRVALWERIAQRIVPKGREADPRARQEARMVLAIALAPTPVVIPWAIMTARLFDAPAGIWAGWLTAGVAPMLWALTWLYHRTGSTKIAANALSVYVFMMMTVVAGIGGGALSPTTYWLLLIPAVAPVLGVRGALIWTVLDVLVCVAYFALERMDASPRNWLNPEVAAMTALSSASTLALNATAMIVLFERAHLAAVEHRAKANEELSAARQVAEQASRRKSDFLANMSHELRTPMTAILGYADLLGEEWSEQPHLRRSVDTIQRNTRQLLALVSDLIDLNRLQEGRIDLERVAFGPEDLARNAAELLRDRALAKALDLSVRVQRPVPERVQGDPTRVRQVLVNLISNAIKFTTTGSVEVRVRAGDGWIRYEVEDTGPGLSEEQMDALLRPLDEDTDASEALAARSGLGLTVSRLLCRLMGGELGVWKARGAGSCFYVQIPAALAPAQRATAEAPQAGAGPVRLRSRVLLVEDSPDTQKLVSLLLRKAGALVTVAGNGQEGLAHIDAAASRGEPFGLVLMDLQMPVLDGYGAVRELRRRGSTVPVVALTAHALEEERLRCLESGFDAFATKPIDRPALLALVREWSREEKAEHL